MQLFPNRYVFVVLKKEQEEWNLMRVSNFGYNERNRSRLLFLFWKRGYAKMKRVKKGHVLSSEVRKLWLMSLFSVLI